MGQILGLGMSHYPGLHMLDEDMWVFLRLTLSGKKVPQRVKEPRNWPQAMREGWADDDGAQAGRLHRERCLGATRALRERLDAFKSVSTWAVQSRALARAHAARGGGRGAA